MKLLTKDVRILSAGTGRLWVGILALSKVGFVSGFCVLQCAKNSLGRVAKSCWFKFKQDDD